MTAKRLRCERSEAFRFNKRGGCTVAEFPDGFESCGACDDEGFVMTTDARGYDVLEPCPFQRLQARVDRFNAVRIPERYAHCSLTAYEPKNRSQSAARQHVEKHVKQFYLPFPGLLFTGPVGTGKTHLMVAILRRLALEHGVQCRFVEFTHMLSDIKEGFSSGRHEAEVLGPICRVPVLGIDELGKGLVTDWQLSVLDEVISRRYNHGVTTYFTTNLPVTASNPRGSQPVTDQSADLRRQLTRAQLIDRIGERIFSRLHEMCTVIEIDGPDHRRG